MYSSGMRSPFRFPIVLHPLSHSDTQIGRSYEIAAILGGLDDNSYSGYLDSDERPYLRVGCFTLEPVSAPSMR